MIELVKKLKTHKDGSETWEVEYSQEFVELIKKHYGLKRVHKSRIKKAILEALTNTTNVMENKND